MSHRSLRASSPTGMMRSVRSGLKAMHIPGKLRHLKLRERPHLRRNGARRRKRRATANIWTLPQINLILKSSRKEFQRASTPRRSNFISATSSLKPPSERLLNLSIRKKHGSKRRSKKLKVYSEKKHDYSFYSILAYIQ